MTIHARIDDGIEGSGLHVPIQHQIWRDKYRYADLERQHLNTDRHISDTWRRVARALAQAEHPAERTKCEARFYGALTDFKFLPGGRIIAGAGTGRAVTLHNCFVMGTVEDSIDGIFRHIREAALTMQQGGGIGTDFSTLRPMGAPVKGVSAEASGPLSFMDVQDAMCRTIMSAGARRGAMMGTMRCDHPDIEAFIEAKLDRNRLRNFNLSVLITDDFMTRVKNDWMFDLTFDGMVYKTVVARELFNKITRTAYDSAEPGVIFIDRINVRNNLRYCETIAATNPCGEQPLPPYGNCLLGSLNLAAFVKEPFSAGAWLDMGALAETAEIAVRMLDNVIDVSNYPLEQQENEAKAKRRIGLGVTGLGDALVMCELHYGSDLARSTSADWMKTIAWAAYDASAALAEEKGPFPLYNAERFDPIYPPRPQDLRLKPLRNSHLLSIAPTGTISLLAGNVSGGIEPIFDLTYSRKVLEPDGSRREEWVDDFAYRRFRELDQDAPLPDYFVTAQELKPEAHLKMQAELQLFIDSAISKTINCPRDIPFEAFRDVYRDAYDMGLKGCTVYRPNDITGAVLTASSESRPDVKELEELLRQEDGAPVNITADGYVEPLDRFDLTDLGREAAGLKLSPRPAALHGSTYKLKWPGSEHALYVTINDLAEPDPASYTIRPYEIFINSKNLEHYPWTVALTRMISAIFRRGGDIRFVAEELKQVFDPRGGAWVKGEYVPSLLAAIGGVIETHFGACGMQSAALAASPARDTSASLAQASEARERPPARESDASSLPLPRTFCPKCSSAAVVMEGGCMICKSCGWSKCS